MDISQTIGHTQLLWFEGAAPPRWLPALLRERPIGGFTLFRHLNDAPPGRLRELTEGLQAAAHAAGQPPLLICADQEGGQLQAIGGLTAFPGNMALGATGDPGLARRVGAAIGAELAALGVNVNYAPVCDVNSDPRNPVIGVRSFGGGPALVAAMAAAMVAGMQESGVAATAKHFPGHGDTAADSHHALARLDHDRARLERVELPPFRAALAAGARLVMAAHLALPALTGRADLPATRSAELLRGLLRDELGFGGVVVSDALNMAGFGPDERLDEQLPAALAAGVDLLLLAPPQDHGRAQAALLRAVADGRLPAGLARAAAARVLELKAWAAARARPGPELIGCAAHAALAAEVAARAITLVRDRAGLLPLRPPPAARVVALTPAAADLTPADTSSYERPDLAAAVRRHHPRAEGLIYPADPSPTEVAALAEHLEGADLAIVGTLNAAERPGQPALLRELRRRGLPTVAAALRLPTDPAACPEAPTYLCSYSIARPALAALADALWGAPAPGRLPMEIE